jgi:hypothetical protein
MDIFITRATLTVRASAPPWTMVPTPDNQPTATIRVDQDYVLQYNVQNNSQMNPPC